jgi:hypothetical protein
MRDMTTGEGGARRKAVPRSSQVKPEDDVGRVVIAPDAFRDCSVELYRHEAKVAVLVGEEEEC